jgi:hypothetical protein
MVPVSTFPPPAGVGSATVTGTAPAGSGIVVDMEYGVSDEGVGDGRRVVAIDPPPHPAIA